MSHWTGESTSRSVADDRRVKDDRRVSATPSIAAAAPEASSRLYDSSASKSSRRRPSPSPDRRPSGRSHTSRYHEEDEYRRSERDEYRRRDHREYVGRDFARYDHDYRDPYDREWRRDERYDGASRGADSRYYDEERRPSRHYTDRTPAQRENDGDVRERRDDRRHRGEYDRQLYERQDPYIRKEEIREVSSSRHTHEERDRQKARSRSDTDYKDEGKLLARRGSDRPRSRERERERERDRDRDYERKRSGREEDRESSTRTERRHDKPREEQDITAHSREERERYREHDRERDRKRDRDRDRDQKDRHSSKDVASHSDRDKVAKDDRGLPGSERDARTNHEGRSSQLNGRRTERRGSTPADDDAFELLRRKESRSTVTDRSNGYRDRSAREGEHKNSSGTHLARSSHEGDGRDQSLHKQAPRSPREKERPARPAQRKSLIEKVMSSPPPDSPQDSVGKDVSLSQPPSQPAPPPLSFGPVKLPHELLEAGNEGMLPKRPDGKKLMPYRLTYDPKLDKKGAGKELIRSTAHSGETQDPRKRSVSRRPVRKDVRRLTWAWDEHSTKAKPPPPPRAICVTGLSPLVTLTQIKQHFRSHGRMDRTDLKLDEKTGESLGVCYVQFAQDYDEDLKLKDDAVDSQRGDLIAKSVVDASKGHRIGDNAFQAMLDDDDRSSFLKECTAAMDRKHNPKRRPSGAAGEERMANGYMNNDAKSRNSSQPHENGAAMPPPYVAQKEIPKGPKALNPQYNGSRSGFSSPHQQGFRAQRSGGNSGYTNSPFAPGMDVRDNYASPRHHDAHPNKAPYLSARARAVGTPAVSHNVSADATRERDSVHEQREPLEDTRYIQDQLAKLGNPYLFVQRVANARINSESIRVHFQAYRPVHVYADKLGWYLAFDNANTAEKSRLLDTIDGVRLTLSVRSCPNESLPKASATKHALKTSWTDESLLQDTILLVYWELGTTFMRELKTRTLKSFVTQFLQLDSPGGQALHPPAKPEIAEAEEDESEEDLPPRKGASRRKSVAIAVEDLDAKETPDADSPAPVVEDEVAAEVVKQKKPKKVKKPSKVKAVNGATVTDVGAAQDVQEEEEEDALPVKAAAKVKAKAKKAKERPKSPPLDPFVSGLAEDEEDLYYLKMALMKMKQGQSIADVEAEAVSAVEAMNADVLDVGFHGLPRHISGSARTEGYYRIQPSEKALHLPDRNRAVVDPSTAVGLASARDNRADSRRFVQGIEQHKKETASDTDILKFNQLRSRKKQLKFAKSPIHDWGLYAMELIPAGDMVIEYVGEIVRQQVADQREKNYERQGNFSTYLFRVDDDVVVDATKKGNIARLMNHCCTPNCNAKILTLNGEKRIVLFAQKTILPGQELTYDYKFQATGDEEDAIACLCGSPGCRRFL